MNGDELKLPNLAKHMLGDEAREADAFLQEEQAREEHEATKSRMLRRQLKKFKGKKGVLLKKGKGRRGKHQRHLSIPKDIDEELKRTAGRT